MLKLTADFCKFNCFINQKLFAQLPHLLIFEYSKCVFLHIYWEIELNRMFFWSKFYSIRMLTVDDDNKQLDSSCSKLTEWKKSIKSNNQAGA